MLTSSSLPAMQVEGAQTPSGVKFAMLNNLNTPQPVLFVFALDIARTFDPGAPYNALGREMAACGWLIVTLDVPGHGEDHRIGEPEELLAWQHRLNNGEDIVSYHVRRVQSVLNHLQENGHVSDSRGIACTGTSRGGFLAMWTCICDARFTHSAPMSPVINLSDVLGGLNLPPAIAHLNSLYTYRENLSLKKTRIYIGWNDTAVHTQNSVTLMRCIASFNPHACAVEIGDSVGHQTPVISPISASKWLASEMGEVP